MVDTTYGTCGKATDDGVTNLDSHFGERCAKEIADLMARSPFRASIFAHVEGLQFPLISIIVINTIVVAVIIVVIITISCRDDLSHVSRASLPNRWPSLGKLQREVLSCAIVTFFCTAYTSSIAIFQHILVSMPSSRLAAMQPNRRNAV